MDARKDPHRHIPRIVADEHLVDLEDRAEPFGQNFGRNMRQIEIDLILAADAVAFETDLKDLARRDIARHQIAVGRIFFFEKIPAFALGNVASDCACRLRSSAPRRGRLRRVPIRSSAAACLRRGSMSDGPE